MGSDSHINERWADWLTRACAGDAAAYNRLLAEMARLLKAYLRPRVADASAIDDLSQEILLAVHKARATFDPAKPVAPWFFAIVHYKMTDYFRRHGRNRRLLAAAAVQAQVRGDVAPAGDQDDAVAMLIAALKELPEKQRRAIELLKFEGMSTKEAAGELGLSLSALKVTAHRGYKGLLGKIKARDEG